MGFVREPDAGTGTWQETTKLVGTVNCTLLREWANYFQVGTLARQAYRIRFLCLSEMVGDPSLCKAVTRFQADQVFPMQIVKTREGQ